MNVANRDARRRRRHALESMGGDDAFPGFGRGLSAADFVRIATNGFGDPQNSYVYSMAYFRGHVYAGTLRNALPLLKLFPPPDAPSMDPWPVKTVDRVEDLDLRAQIWRWDLAAEQWENVLTSPMIAGRNGVDAPRDIGYRGMVVFTGRSDTAPTLYVSTVSTVLRGTAARILRSEDGLSFTPVSEPGLGSPNISAFRSLIVFDDHLFAAPAGEGTTWNTTRNPVILRSADPVEGRWDSVCPPGFGDPTNTGVFEMAVFDDHLYAGTFNHHDGFQIWKTPAVGTAPCRWTKVIERGAYRGNLNETTMGMCAFNGALYVGTGIQNGGYDRTNMVGPAAGELIRIYPDDSWELVVGTPRWTPDGMMHPCSGMGPGFDNLFSGYIWRMTVHDGWLYASTFDWSMFLAYARRPSQQVKRMMRQIGVDEMIQRGGGFELWRTRDGEHWIPVTRDGMGNPYNHGGRTLLSTPHGLFLGTANPFGPEVAAKLSTGWIYVQNPDGGAEVWLGRTQPQPENGPHTMRNGQDSAEAQIQEGARRRHSSSRISALRPSIYTGGYTMPRVLLTGPTDFIGTHVLDQLLAREDRIRVFALPGTVADIGQRDRVEVVIGSLADESRVLEAVRGMKTIYHLGGLLPGSSPEDLLNVNVHGAENLLRACGRTGEVHRFVFLSSVAVYGTASSPLEWPLTELSPVLARSLERLKPYAASKIAAERMVRHYADQFGFEYVILRSSTSYGPGRNRIGRLVRWVLTYPEATYTIPEGPYTQLIHIDDLARVMVQAGTRSEAANEVFNVAGAEVVSYRSLVTMIRRLGGINDDWTLRPDPSTWWRRVLLMYDIEKAQRKLGFMPRVMLNEGMAEMVDAFEASPSLAFYR